MGNIEHSKPEDRAVAALYDWACTEWNWGGDEYQSVRDAVNVVVRALDYRGTVDTLREIRGDLTAAGHPKLDARAAVVKLDALIAHLGGQ